MANVAGEVEQDVAAEKIMKNKKIDRIKVMFGKYRSLEAEGLPESSLIYLLLTFLLLMAASLFTWFYR